MNFTPGVNFTNILLAAFTPSRSQKRKNTVKSLVSFCDFWNLHKKTARKMMVKLTPSAAFVAVWIDSNNMFPNQDIAEKRTHFFTFHK